ncbi:hypothetical protein IAU59_000463 [Kwoniella sp. CBS 9459]
MTSREGSTTALEVPNESSSTWYLRHLDTHIRTSRDHVQGETYGVRFQSSFRDTVVPPFNAIWTPEEKSLFFASLRRHSRFRADLIAAAVGSKSEIEVEWYLDLLESGASQVGQVDANRINGKQRARWDGSRSWREGLAPACREVSAKWIAREEGLAEEVTAVMSMKEVQDRSETSRRMRRAERCALKRTLPHQSSWSYHEKQKHLREHRLVKDLEKRWLVEDWGEEISVEKLSTLNHLMRPDWCEWYSERVRLPSPHRTQLPDQLSDDEANHAAASPKKGDPQGKIAHDMRNFQYLSSIPKSERTPAQRRDLAAIVNRRRNREKYRLAKLLDEGMTKDEIERAGGADAVFASRDRDQDQDQDQGQGDYRRKDTLSGKEAEEEGSVNQLKKLGMYDHLMLSGMEVFNYEMMARLISQLAPSTPPNISFSVLRKIHAELVTYLRSLTYNAIVIAEQAYHQRPYADEESKAEEQEQEEGEMTSDHVYQALALAGAEHPLKSLREAIERIFRHEYGDEGDVENEGSEGDHEAELSDVQEEQQNESSRPGKTSVSGAIEEDPVPSHTDNTKPHNLRRARYATHLLSQSEDPWHLIPSLYDAQLNASTSAEPGNAAVDPDAQSDLEPEPEVDFSALSDAATEQEDDELDQALEKMDRRHDALYEKALEGAAKRKRSVSEDEDQDTDEDQKDGIDDGGDVWTSMTVQRINGRTVRLRSKIEQDYIDLLFQIDNARRKRQFVQRREARYPTTRLRKKAREHKGIKSAAFVIDSDSDEDSDDENTYVPGRQGEAEAGADGMVASEDGEDDEQADDESAGEGEGSPEDGEAED